MRSPLTLVITAASLALAGGAASAPLWAENQARTAGVSGGITRQGGYLQCVPYARQVSGIRIFGDAHTWWGQAEGKFARGDKPRVGAVMNFRPHGNSRLGHVAAVSKIVDSRTVLIRHANWSVRGGIEDDVRAVDVSEHNDWSRVRVWYGPGKRLGASQWPLYGFIYNEKPGRKAKPAKTAAPREREQTARLGAIGGEIRELGAKLKAVAKPKAVVKPQILPAMPDDPLGRIIAQR